MVVVPCLGCSWRNARYLPAGRDQAGDRHFKFHDERDNLLIEAIEEYIAHNNDDPRPFIWTKTAGEIIAKVRRGKVALEAVRQSRVI